MNREIVKEILQDEFVYRIIHTHRWGDLAPEGSEESDWHALDTIGIYKAQYTEGGDEDTTPWVYLPFANLHFWDAPTPYIQGTLMLATQGIVDNESEEGVFPIPENMDLTSLKQKLESRSLVTFLCSLRGRDSGSAHSDPHNDIVTSKSCSIHWLDVTRDQRYEHSFGYGCDAWGIATAYTYLVEANENGRSPEFSDEEKETITGFEFCQHVFGLKWPITDKRVVGYCISGTYKDLKEGDDSFIADRGDRYEQMFTYHHKGVMYAVNYSIYLNGKCLIEDFREWLTADIGVPKCVVPYLSDSVLDMAFYKSQQLIPVIQQLAEEPIHEFVGWDGGSTTNIEPLTPHVDCAIKFPVIYDDDSKELIHIQLVPHMSPWDGLMKHFKDNAQWERIAYIGCLGYWLAFDGDDEQHNFSVVSFKEGQDLDALLRA